MRRRATPIRVVILLAAIGISGIGARAEAQVGGPYPGASSRPIRIAFGGGVSVPTGDYKKAFENGVNGQGSIIFNFAGFPIALRADLSYNRFSFKERPEIVVPGLPGQPGGTVSFDGTSQVLGALGNVSVPVPLGPITPYVMAGLGAFSIRTEIDASNGGEESDSQMKFGINGGAGIAVRLGGIDAFVEARLSNVYTDAGLIDFKQVRFVPVTFGLVF